MQSDSPSTPQCLVYTNLLEPNFSKLSQYRALRQGSFNVHFWNENNSAVRVCTVKLILWVIGQMSLNIYLLLGIAIFMLNYCACF